MFHFFQDLILLHIASTTDVCAIWSTSICKTLLRTTNGMDNIQRKESLFHKMQQIVNCALSITGTSKKTGPKIIKLQLETKLKSQFLGPDVHSVMSSKATIPRLNIFKLSGQFVQT